MAVTSAELRGATRIQDLFGAAPERELRLTVENLGDVAITAPGLSIAVGKGDPEPVFLSDGIGRLEPGQVARITVPIALPVGAHGTYTITGRVGDGERGEFGLTWETYPWGLLGLNGLGVLLVAWALQRRFMAPAAPLIAAGTPPVTETLGVADGEAVIDLDTLERWWALQVATSGEAADAVVDEGAVDRWIERCRERDLTQL
ncbi:hypothetical protein [Nocardioides alcanivorans]|uniref:hypothetical protein n=1 Tax=Nocardioides alcanivorans TaxID=2897352 RepID=UPI001F41FE6C|nr:hypothetical protein [Nocardioides alcanivorans]